MEEPIDALLQADEGNMEALFAYTYSHGGRDPTIGELIGNPFFAKQLDGERMFSMAKALLRRGADPNDTSWKGLLPLDLAHKTRNEKLVQLLISAGDRRGSR